MATSRPAGISSQSQDIRSQIPEMEAHARGQDSVRWYTDSFTGTQMDRPGWEKLMVDVRTGLIPIDGPRSLTVE